MSEGTSPSSSSDDGSRSTPSNLPKAATRARKKKTSESEDEDYVAAEDEATSKKKVLRKEYGTAATIKPGMKIKVPAKRTPMSKARSLYSCARDIRTQRGCFRREEEEGKGQEDHGQSCWTTFHDGRGGRRGCCTSTQGTKADG